MKTFSAAEITDAYEAFHQKVAGFVASGDWTGYADLFTPDAVYVEHAMGTFRGREEIRAWSVRTMTSYPGRVMTGFPLSWQVVDADAARLVCEVRNPMPDPGDGTMLEEPNITIMTYAGDGLFSREEDGRFLAIVANQGVTSCLCHRAINCLGERSPRQSRGRSLSSSAT
ncbi:hypothetical protein D0Z08_30090, partial [Nocardioides immobilis]